MASADVIYSAAKRGNLALQEHLKNCANINDVRNSDGETALHLAARNGHLHASQLLIYNNANVHEKDNSGQTPLHLSATFGRVDVLKVLISNKANVHEKDKSGQTPLHVAALYGNVKASQVLIGNNANVHEKDKSGQTPLDVARLNSRNTVVNVLLEIFSTVYSAAKEGNLALQEELEKCANINELKNSNGFTALHWAARYGDVQASQVLISNNANVHEKDNSGQTPLHLSAIFGHVQASQVLISNSANVDEKNNSGQSPLHLAALNGINTVVKLLLDNVSCVSEVDNDKNTPLHLALAHSGDLNTVKLLLQHSDDIKSLVSSTNEKKQMPFHLGTKSSIKLLLEFISNQSASDKEQNTPLHLEIDGNCDFDVIKLMIEHSEDVKSIVNAANENQQTPLHLAGQKGKDKVIKLLLENSSCVSTLDKDKNTPLHLALGHSGDLDTVKLLLEHSEDVKCLVNAVNENQQTPLHLASQKGNNSVTKLLLEKSSCVQTVDKDMNTPLHLCLAHSGDLDTVKLLLEYSEDVKCLVNAANENQETAIHLAVNKDFEIVRLLIENSSCVSAENKDKKTPLKLAIRNQKRNVAELLTRFDVLKQSGFTVDVSEDPGNLHSLVIFDDFSAIESFLQVSLFQVYHVLYALHFNSQFVYFLSVYRLFLCFH